MLLLAQTDIQLIIQHLETLIDLSSWAVRLVAVAVGVLLFRYASLRSTI